MLEPKVGTHPKGLGEKSPFCIGVNKCKESNYGKKKYLFYAFEVLNPL